MHPQASARGLQSGGVLGEPDGDTPGEPRPRGGGLPPSTGPLWQGALCPTPTLCPLLAYARPGVRCGHGAPQTQGRLGRAPDPSGWVTDRVLRAAVRGSLSMCRRPGWADLLRGLLGKWPGPAGAGGAKGLRGGRGGGLWPRGSHMSTSGEKGSRQSEGPEDTLPAEVQQGWGAYCPAAPAAHLSLSPPPQPPTPVPTALSWVLPAETRLGGRRPWWGTRL